MVKFILCQFYYLFLVISFRLFETLCLPDGGAQGRVENGIMRLFVLPRAGTQSMDWVWEILLPLKRDKRK